MYLTSKYVGIIYIHPEDFLPDVIEPYYYGAKVEDILQFERMQTAI